MGTAQKTPFFLAVVFTCCISTTAAAAVLTNADLNGRYVVSQWMAGETLVYELEFDGIGTLTDVVLLNASFEISSEDIDRDTAASLVIGIPEKTSYLVDPDGSFLFAGTDMAGTLSSDGRIFSFVRTNPGELPQINIGVRKSSGLSNSVLVGNYYIHVFEIAVGSTVNELQTNSYMIRASADAIGRMGGEVIAGSILGFDLTFRAGYRVEETGLLYIERDGLGSPDIGAVSADGFVFAAVDTNRAEDGDLRIMVGVRAADEGELRHELFFPNYFYTELLASAQVVFSTDQFADFFGQINFDGSSGFQRIPMSATCDDCLNPETGSVRLLSDGLFQFDGLIGTMLPDGRFFAATRTESGLTGLRIGVANATVVDTDRRRFVIDPDDHDSCFISAAKH